MALYRAAYASSTATYDNTAHLATDGDLMQRVRTVSAQYTDSPPGETMAKAFDGTTSTKYLTPHQTGWIRYAFPAGESHAVDQYSVASANDNPARDPQAWTLLGSNDGTNWTTLDTQSGLSFPTRLQTLPFPIRNKAAFAMYQFNVTANGGDSDLQFSEIGLFEGGMPLVDTQALTSEWQSGSGDPQWIYVDLGGPSIIDEVKLFWDAAYATTYDIDVSNDATTWTSVYATSSGNGGVEDVPLTPTSTRYVRVNATASATGSDALIELEVYGTGGATAEPTPLPPAEANGSQYLSGGNWRVQRAARVQATAAQVSAAGFDDSSWLVATVPGTVLTSYLKDGAIPDPNFDNQQFQISDAFFTADFWYRDSFTIPTSYCGKRVWLELDGVNWKADVYLNGASVGSIAGAFQRGRFDVTENAVCGGVNYLAVYIHENANPGEVKVKTLASAGPNGGLLGQDSPSILAALGWDWMPTIRGRAIGIQDNVWISSTADVSILDPWVSTVLPLPSTSPAALTVSADLINASTSAVSGTLSGAIEPGGVQFQQSVSLGPLERTTISLGPNQVAGLSIANPQLWWPNGYGAQNLYTLTLQFSEGGAVSDAKTVSFGIRQITSDTKNGVLTLYVNGAHLFVRGGNWGMPDAMLPLGAQDYDVRVRLHKEQNFNMIRNWIGMTGSDAFYDACDKYGITIWNDFWLANPADGPDPNDLTMFMNNAADRVRRVRNHPSLALWCGRNEGFPPSNIEANLPNTVTRLDGTRPYIGSSADDPVDGHGPYGVKDPVFYFHYAGPKIHSEIGMPTVPSLESMQAMLSPANLWPINDVWGLHDYCNSGATASSYTSAINTSYGAASGLADYVRKAQMVNMENYKAIFESREGLNGSLIWMSQAAWPSTVWQTFDYYLEPTAGYFAAKQGSEPLHIFWDGSTDEVKVANNTLQSESNLTAEAVIYNLDGTQQYSNSVAVSPGAGTVTTCFTITYPSGLSPTHFLRLRLLNGTSVRSDNFYWRGTTYQDYTALASLPQVTLTGNGQRAVRGTVDTITAAVTNSTSNVALMVRLKLLRATSGARVLPTFYSDNYFSLLPGESKQVTLEFDEQYLAGEDPKLAVEGWNIVPGQIPVGP